MLAPAPYEHVVSMLLAFPLLKEIDIVTPRPLDVALFAHVGKNLAGCEIV